VSAAIIALYFWVYFATAPNIGKSFAVDALALYLASATAFVCFVSYLWIPKKFIFPVTLAIYWLLAATTIALIISTGGISSSFIALWIIVVIFAGIFGLWGSLPILIAISIFTTNQYLGQNLTVGSMIVIALTSILPLIASVIIWHDKSAKEELDSDSRNYRDLANELSDVTSKSEVVINAIGDGVIAVDGQGIVRLINPAAQRIIGWGKQDALALNYKSVLQLVNQKGEPLDTVNDPVQQVLNINQQIRTNDFTAITKGDKKIAISLVVSPVSEVGSGVIAVFHDITKEKAEERGQAEFISTASHEMRTPVASIEGYLGLALNPQTATIDTRARDFILKAHESAEHLGHLFQDLLDVSRADDGRLSNNPKVVDVVTFVHDIVQGLEQKASDRGLRLVYEPIPDGTKERHLAPVCYVNLDNDHIREIVNNLVENAIKYTLAGEVVVDVSGDDDQVIISVKDSGIGINTEDIPHLFQKFYRVDNKDTREIGGTGLGLYICRRLAEIMGGRIWAESTRNKGSTFFVELPRISSKEANHLLEQQTIKAKQEANEAATQSEPANAPQAASIPVAKNFVPRSNSLTAEQIAAYVSRQRELAQQQTVPPRAIPPETPANQVGTRSQSVSIPTRGLVQ
jgi:PAS domain S-box-containing protein